MSILDDIQQTVAKIAELLRSVDDNNWATSFDRLLVQIQTDPEIAVSNIKGIYGGMGSFNELVLCKDRQPLISENDKLDALRTKLFELCVAFRTLPHRAS